MGIILVKERKRLKYCWYCKKLIWHFLGKVYSSGHAWERTPPSLYYDRTTTHICRRYYFHPECAEKSELMPNLFSRRLNKWRDRGSI